MPGPIGPNPGMMAAQRAAQQASRQATQNAQQAAQRASMNAQQAAQRASMSAQRAAQQAAQRASMNAQQAAQRASMNAQAQFRAARPTTFRAPLSTRQATPFRSDQTQYSSRDSGFDSGALITWIVIIGLIVLIWWLFF